MSQHALVPAGSAAIVSSGRKLKLLLGLLAAHPVEFYDRVRTAVEARLVRGEPGSQQVPISPGELLQRLSNALGVDCAALAGEPACEQAARTVAQRQQQLGSQTAFGSFHNADVALARLCYAVVRARRPQYVVETGVGFGVTSAFLLAALAQNEAGELWSLDLPPLGEHADEQVGFLVAPGLRDRWHLVRGSCRRTLPGVLRRLGTIDIFVHDSLHTCAHMTWEYEQAWTHLGAGGLLLSDDVDQNLAFQQFAVRHRGALALVAAEHAKKACYGLLLKPTA